MDTQESNLSLQNVGGFTESLIVERIKHQAAAGPECRPGRSLPDYVVHHTEGNVNVMLKQAR
jgi:hypothetical protein